MLNLNYFKSLTNNYLNIDASEIYDQFVSEVQNSRKLIMNPYDDFQLQPKDYILWIGELNYPIVKSFLR